MKKYINLLLVVLVAATISSCTSGDWRVYKASEFTVEFPGMVHDTATMEGNLAGIRVYFEPVQGSLDSNLYYAVSMYTLPDSITVLGNNMDDLFRQDVQIYAWSIGGVLADSGRTVKSGDVEGREYSVFLAHNSGVATVRKFAYGKHLYTLLVVTDNMRLNNAAIRHFMDSFRFTGKAESKPQQ